MKNMRNTVSFFIVCLSVFACTCCKLSAQSVKPLHRMTNADATSFRKPELVQMTILQWEDILLNINFGMKYSEWVIDAFSAGFKRGYDRYCSSVDGSSSPNKRILVFDLVQEVEKCCYAVADEYEEYSDGDYYQAAKTFYKMREKCDEKKALKLKEKAIKTYNQDNRPVEEWFGIQVVEESSMPRMKHRDHQDAMRVLILTRFVVMNRETLSEKQITALKEQISDYKRQLDNPNDVEKIRDYAKFLDFYSMPVWFRDNVTQVTSSVRASYPD
ncbi:hypothetical protein [Parabacteroides sp. PF5-6]|uniref:hypothetical protein n=1 Tax=Parabacteroides sp. PF5-6 TaxID=1742403 RepID=UPI002405E764|nr:hypothetical protein [Parabacteroides sp. PF5-6]MDF9831787.1 hypothetical protein [Parabacteroides sp. PF5-6]